MDTSAAHTVEGIARVVAVQGEIAWLEPEQTTSCGGCSASASCGTSSSSSKPGIGSIANRIAARRFPMDNRGQGLAVGERVVVGVNDRALIKASLIAYAIPLLAAFGAAIFAQASYGDDATTLIAMVTGLFGGLILARIGATWLAGRGELAPRFLRRARPDESCNG